MKIRKCSNIGVSLIEEGGSAADAIIESVMFYFSNDSISLFIELSFVLELSIHTTQILLNIYNISITTY